MIKITVKRIVVQKEKINIIIIIIIMTFELNLILKKILFRKKYIAYDFVNLQCKREWGGGLQNSY